MKTPTAPAATRVTRRRAKTAPAPMSPEVAAELARREAAATAPHPFPADSPHAAGFAAWLDADPDRRRTYDVGGYGEDVVEERQRLARQYVMLHSPPAAEYRAMVALGEQFWAAVEAYLRHWTPMTAEGLIAAAGLPQPQKRESWDRHSLDEPHWAARKVAKAIRKFARRVNDSVCVVPDKLAAGDES